MVTFDYFSLSLFIGGVIAFGSGTFVWYQKGRSHRAWGLLSICTAVWSMGYFSMLTATSVHVATLSNQILHFGAIFIPVTYTYFIITLTDNIHRYIKYLFFLILCTVFFTYLNTTPYLLEGVSAKFLFSFAPNAGPFYLLFTMYFFFVVIFALFILFLTMRKVDANESLRLRFVLISSALGFFGGGSVFFYTFDIPIAPYPLILFAFYPIIIAYATVKHKLFNMKTVAAEAFIIIIWSLLLIRTILSKSFTDRLFDISVLIASIFLGVMVIRSVLKEVENREKGEKLARYLANANARLRELDKQKTEFVSIASHQLRSPIAAIKGYTSMIMEGSFGKVPKNLDEPLGRILESGLRIAVMVDDLLNVTRIEQGRMIYNMGPQNAFLLVNTVVNELKVIAEKKGLELTLTPESNQNCFVKADEGKLKQIFSNLIDNAIKYTPKGSIQVTVSKMDEEKKVLVHIQDTGIGIAPDEVQKLFIKFDRASNANEVNVLGTGLGLYIAREILKDHDGWINVESEGIGKGSAFIVELPACDENLAPTKEEK